MGVVKGFCCLSSASLSAAGFGFLGAAEGAEAAAELVFEFAEKRVGGEWTPYPGVEVEFGMATRQ